MNFKQTFQFLESLSNISKPLKKTNPKFAFERTKYFFNLISNPQDKIKNYIHITGTSGKGTCAYLIQKLLTKHNIKTGIYTSPHIYSPCERIKINSKLIPKKEFVKILKELEPKISEMAYKSKFGAPSYFEVFFAIACKYFEKQKCEFVIVEVGMGGEFDATNVIPSPKIAILTNIGLEHTQFLGKTLKAITNTKLGILKKGTILITTEKQKKLLKIIKTKAKKIGAKKIIIINETKYSNILKDIKLNYISNENLKIIIEIAKIFKLDYKKFLKNLSKFKIPGRFDVIKLNSKKFIILDGAHNSYKIKFLCKNIRNFVIKNQIKNIFIIFASHKEKDWKKMLDELLKLHPKKIIITKTLILEKKSVDFKNYYNFFKKRNFKNFDFYINPYTAFEFQKKLNSNEVLLITGSFFLLTCFKNYKNPGLL